MSPDNFREKGDHIIIVKIAIPTNMSLSEKNVFENLS